VSTASAAGQRDTKVGSWGAVCVDMENLLSRRSEPALPLEVGEQHEEPDELEADPVDDLMLRVAGGGSRKVAHGERFG
jgi:hypothetical protein